MPDGPQTAFGEGPDDSQHRPERRPLVCFAGDAATEEALRAGLSDGLRAEAEFRRADVTRAIAMLREMPTPWTVVVDVAGHPQPLAALDDLSHVVEPDVRVLVVGDREDVGFYRQLTRGLGVADYLYKPLTPAMVSEHFGPVLARRRFQAVPARGGKLLSVTGVRGGVGASTIAANLAWYLAQVARRHTIALDADLHRGTQALLLAAQSGPGLRNALEHPDRVDELFIERAATEINERLHLLAAEEALTLPLAYAPQAADRLIALLRRRYNFIVADAPFQADAVGRALLDLAQHRILVMEPTLACIRDALRLLQLPPGPGQSQRPLLVLNRAGRKGALSQSRVAEALKLEPDVVIPDLPKAIEDAATLGEPAASGNGAFRSGIAQLARGAGGVGQAELASKGLFGWLGRRGR